MPPGFSEGQRLWVELFSHAAAEQVRQIYRGRPHEAGPLVSPLLEPNHEPTPKEKLEAAEAVANAVVERERWREELLRWMRLTPLIIAPVCATPAFEHGAPRVNVNGKSVSIFRSCSYSQTVNVFGLPAVAVPVSRTVKGLPVGIQIIGRPFQESEVLAVAAIIEHSTAF
jgi:Asp-tRNA(Asn)/Glu-tRNA(Gln) amidotransferase A subunit family amidase